jgi:diaminopimelate decarboxylase
MKLVVQALQKEGVELVGFHCHCGSQVFEVQPFIEQARVMFDFMYAVKVKTGYEAKVMDIGGGFGVRYTESDPHVDIEDNIRQISEEIKRICAQKDLKMPDILMEPGRSIVAAAGVTLYTVGSVKEIEGYRTYVAVDGGMTDNPRYALYKSRYEVLIANKADKPKDLVCTVAGRCCESGDMIGEEMELQTPVRGDILATLVTGAYNYSMASNYNRIPRPAMVFVNNGTEYLAVKRESFEQLYENDI